jgi:hypothetical protein
VVSEELSLPVPAELFEQLAQRAAEIVLERQASRDNGWLRGAKEIADYIQAPKSRVYALSSAGRIPVEHDGSTLVAKPAALDEWLRNGGAKRP